ncbi:ATPase, histidine kinase/DNA gyrase B/HSP90-like protein [Leptolyngbyaceae cyanobacterium JSC-12]|nr:ATPase, histidine kinase/DNA gyrase B/HSP90-like protein [Leptolyngbyaceae cyanobacterium JSC-12]
MRKRSASISPRKPSMVPTLSNGSCQALHLEAVLQDLPLHRFEISIDCSGTELAQVFERYPLLPGAVLVDERRLVGMISRQRLLEFLIRPHGMEMFLQEPLRVLHSYAQCECLLLSGETSILTAAQQALRRSPELLGEPIIVQVDQSHYLLDVHELNIAHWQIRGIETQVRYERTQAQMIQTDKMANLGRLVDGVAHEILDPVSFIWGNLSHIASYSQDLFELLTAYEHTLPNPPTQVAQLREAIELDYLRQDLPRAIESVKTGAERLSKLATSLQNFCHIDEIYPKPTNLHESIDSILLLLKSRLTSDITVIKHYGNLPPIMCYPGQLNQVFMNILSTCLDSLLIQAVSQQLDLDLKTRRNQIKPSSAVPTKPAIAITTEVCSLPEPNGGIVRWVSVQIADNGPGLSREAQRQLMESFSIQRRTEKETSLAVSYQIVTAKHGGRFKVRSRSAATNELRRIACSDRSEEELPLQVDDNLTGTEFEILLPLI